MVNSSPRSIVPPLITASISMALLWVIASPFAPAVTGQRALIFALLLGDRRYLSGVSCNWYSLSLPATFAALVVAS